MDRHSWDVEEVKLSGLGDQIPRGDRRYGKRRNLRWYLDFRLGRLLLFTGVGGKITYRSCEVCMKQELSALSACACLDPFTTCWFPTCLCPAWQGLRVFRGGLLSAFWGLLCLMHIELELPRNLYPPGDTWVQMCIPLCCSSVEGTCGVIHIVSIAPPWELLWDFAWYHISGASLTSWWIFPGTLLSQLLSGTASSQGLLLGNQNKDWEP